MKILTPTLTFLAGCAVAAAVTVAVTPEPEPVKVSDPACIDAIDKGEDLNDLMDEALQEYPDWVNAAFDRDLNRLDIQSDTVRDLNKDIEDAQEDFDFASASCTLGEE